MRELNSSSLNNNQQPESKSRINSSHNEDFFVITHNVEPSSFDYLRDKPIDQITKPVELRKESPTIRLKLLPLPLKVKQNQAVPFK